MFETMVVAFCVVLFMKRSIPVILFICGAQDMINPTIDLLRSEKLNQLLEFFEVLLRGSAKMH